MWVTFEGAGEFDDVGVVELPHALDFLLDVLDEVRFLGELFLVNALNRVHLVVCRFELDLFD